MGQVQALAVPRGSRERRHARARLRLPTGHAVGRFDSRRRPPLRASRAVRPSGARLFGALRRARDDANPRRRRARGGSRCRLRQRERQHEPGEHQARPTPTTFAGHVSILEREAPTRKRPARATQEAASPPPTAGRAPGRRGGLGAHATPAPPKRSLPTRPRPRRGERRGRTLSGTRRRTAGERRGSPWRRRSPRTSRRRRRVACQRHASCSKAPTW